MCSKRVVGNLMTPHGLYGALPISLNGKAHPDTILVQNMCKFVCACVCLRWYVYVSEYILAIGLLSGLCLHYYISPHTNCKLIKRFFDFSVSVLQVSANGFDMPSGSRGLVEIYLTLIVLVLRLLSLYLTSFMENLWPQLNLPRPASKSIH